MPTAPLPATPPAEPPARPEDPRSPATPAAAAAASRRPARPPPSRTPGPRGRRGARLAARAGGDGAAAARAPASDPESEARTGGTGSDDDGGGGAGRSGPIPSSGVFPGVEGLVVHGGSGPGLGPPPTAAAAVAAAAAVKAKGPTTTRKTRRPKPLTSISDTSYRHPRYSPDPDALWKRRPEEDDDSRRFPLEPREYFIEVPGLLDGFFLLNRSQVTDPSDVFKLDITNNGLYRVTEDDLPLFRNLHELDAGENALAMSMLAGFPALSVLRLPFNSIVDLDPGATGRFHCLTRLDLSYNALSHNGLVALANLPALEELDLTGNGITTFPLEILRVPAFPKTEPAASRPAEEAREPEQFGEDPEVGGKTPAGEDLSSGDGAGSRRQSADLPQEVRIPVPRTENRPRSEADGSDPEADSSDARRAARGRRPSGERPPTAGDPAEFRRPPGRPDSNPQRKDGTATQRKDSRRPPSAATDRTGCISRATDRTGCISRARTPGTPTAAEKVSGFMRTPADGSVRVGFPSLTILNLENNRVRGALNFSILGKLPRLRILNLNHNHINSVKFLSISDLHNEDWSLREDASLSYHGFLCLEELSLAFNCIRTEEHLMGVVHLPVLRKLYLEGNPVVQNVRRCRRGAPPANQPFVPADRPSTPMHLSNFDPLIVLPTFYDIQVADVVFSKPKGLPKFQSWKSRLRRHRDGIKAPANHHDFISVDESVARSPPKMSEARIDEMLGQAARGDDEERGRPGSGRRSGDEGAPKEAAAEEEAGRDLPSEGEAARGPFAGRGCPGFRAGGGLGGGFGRKPGGLRRLPGFTSQETQDGELENEKEEEEEEELGAVREQAPAASDGGGEASRNVLVYEPEAKDRTFLTSVHITSGELVTGSGGGGGGAESENANAAGGAAEESRSSERDGENLAEAGRDELAAEDILGAPYAGPPLPTKIQAAVRALRAALRNPVYHWRGSTAATSRGTGGADGGGLFPAVRYAEPTFAAKVRTVARMEEAEGWARAREREEAAQGRRSPRRAAEQRRRGGGGGGGAKLPPAGEGVEEEEEEEEEEEGGRLAFYEQQQQQQQRRVPQPLPPWPGDTEELENMMHAVDKRLRLVEKNLEAVLASDNLRRHIPRSRALLKEVRAAYERASDAANRPSGRPSISGSVV